MGISRTMSGRINIIIVTATFGICLLMTINYFFRDPADAVKNSSSLSSADIDLGDDTPNDVSVSLQYSKKYNKKTAQKDSRIRSKSPSYKKRRPTQMQTTKPKMVAQNTRRVTNRPKKKFYGSFHNLTSSVKQQREGDSPDLRVQTDHVSHITGALYTNKRRRKFPSHKVQFAEERSSTKATANTTQSAQHTRCRKWSVVTTIFEASDAVKKQSNVGGGWCMVIVGDRRSPPLFRTAMLSGATVYLNVTAQEKLAKSSAFVDMLPWNHFGRKNLGYLYAIQHGAEAVWDFDDDNLMKPPVGGIPMLKVPTLTKEYSVQTVRGHTFPTLNPYPVMGAPYFPTWPRGLPLDHIRKQDCHNLTGRLTATRIRGADIGVIQSLADNDPDVDAIMRLTLPLPFRFTTPAANRGKWLLLPRATYTPFNAQATVVMGRSLWMLFLPITVTSRVTDIWRSYIGTRLARDVGQRILFSPPIVDQYRNSHNYLADFESETHLYLRSGALVKLLNAWRPRSNHFVGRIEELWIHLYEYAYIEMLDVKLTQAWLHELLLCGYRFPKLINVNAVAQNDV